MTIRVARRMEGVERTLIRRIFDSAPPDAINLGLGQPDLPSPPVVALSGIAGIVGGRTAYTSTAGDPELRAAVAATYPGFATGAQDVVVTVGSQEAMFVTCLALLDPGDELLYPDPGYPAYPIIARLLGAAPVAYPLAAGRGFRTEASTVLERVGTRTRAVILCTPSNPTGASIERHELELLTARLAELGVPWISDEIYSGFSWNAPFVSPSAFGPGTGVVVSGLSKDVSMTGWRIGWVVGPSELIERITTAHQYVVTCASSVSQRAALGAFGARGESARHGIVERFRRRRDVMGEELSRVPGLRFSPPDGAFYYFVDVSAHGSSLDIARRALERRKVVTIPGEAFGAQGAGWIRLSFACDEAGIREGVRRFAAELLDG